jgi:hypothetical protein
MGKYDKIAKRLERIIKQFTENPNKADGRLIPEAAIKGSGHIWCYCPAKKTLIRIPRGTKVFIVDDKEDRHEKILIYTICGRLVEIEPDELINTGFD